MVALADAFARLGEGRLTFLGDGPLRPALEGRVNVDLPGRVPHADVPAWIARADVICQPSLSEAFGQASLEAMAMERTVVATTDGGPPEFVTPEAGVLVDPSDPDALVAALREAAGRGTPHAAARVAAAEHDVRLQTARMLEVLEAVRSRWRPAQPRAASDLLRHLPAELQHHAHAAARRRRTSRRTCSGTRRG